MANNCAAFKLRALLLGRHLFNILSASEIIAGQDAENCLYCVAVNLGSDQFGQNRRRYLAAIHNQSSAQHWEVFPQRALGAIDVNFFALPSNPNISGGMRKLQKTALKIEQKQINFSETKS